MAYPILTDAARSALLDALAADTHIDLSQVNAVQNAAIGSDVTDQSTYPPLADDELGEAWLEAIVTYHGLHEVDELWQYTACPDGHDDYLMEVPNSPTGDVYCANPVHGDPPVWTP